MNIGDDGGTGGPIFEASPNPILVAEIETLTIVEANEAASELFELSRAQLCGCDLGSLPGDGSTVADRERSTDQPVTWNIDRTDGRRVVEVQFRRATVAGETRLVCYIDQPESGTDRGPLHDREEHLETVTGNLPVILFALDADGTFQMSQGNALEKLGLEPGEAVGSTVYELYADQPEILTEIDKALSGTEVRYTAELGELVFETWLQPEFDEHGEVASVIGLARDITEQREYEQQLEKNSAILQQLTEATEDVFWLFDSEFTELQFVNEAYEEVWGLSVDALEEDAMSFMRGVHPDDRDIVTSAVQDLRNGHPSREEYRVNPDESFSRWVSVHGEPVFDEDGSVTRAAGYARDITERKQREQQLETLSEATRRLALAKTPDDVATRVIEIANEALQRPLAAIWRYDESDDRLTPWQTTDRIDALVGPNELSDITDPETFEMERFRSGEPVAVEQYGSLEEPKELAIPLAAVLFVPIGEYGLLAVGSDESTAFSTAEQNLASILASNAKTAFERAEREQELETYKNKLEESNQNLQEFAYIASHDLQEPLRSVTSYLGLLEDEYGEQLDETAGFYIDRATSNATRMSTMVDALLQYSRVQTDAGTVDEVDTESVVEDTLESLEILIRETDAEITVGSLPVVAADSDQLGQVFQNLIKNAIEHGGEPPEVEISAEQTAREVTFAISDNGAGIPKANHERIFEIFQQATTDTDTDGTGIGLAICERIVSRHDGEIWVESDETGSTFKVLLPKG